MNRGKPLVLSASRRTDLPGFHAEACAKRIRLRISRLRTRPLAGVVFWTKHVDSFLAGGPLCDLVRSEIDNPLVNLTVTGFGDSPLEPRTPKVDHVLRNLPELLDVFKGDPQRIRWRFDPLLKNHSSIDTFARVGRAMSSLGVTTCTFSFPAYRSLKGDLTPQFERAGISAWQKHEKIVFLREMSEVAADLNIALLSCSQPENTRLASNIKPAQCIPFDVLALGFPAEELSVLAKDRSQRTHCNCIESEDIGDYNEDICLGGCVYCYSKASC